MPPIRASERDADPLPRTMRKLGRSAAPRANCCSGSRRGGERTSTSSPVIALTEERLEAMKKDLSPVTGAALLSDGEWRALKRIAGRNGITVPDKTSGSGRCC